MKKTYLWGGIIIAGLGFVLWMVLASNNASAADLRVLDGKQVTLYQSMSCGCCGVYGQYVNSKTKANLQVSRLVDTSGIKEKYKIPAQLQSCHTMTVDGYYVEGHIPLEVVAKLVRERPSDVVGIALPGMPSGSPGMPGSKDGTWIIDAVHQDGSITEFMRV